MQCTCGPHAGKVPTDVCKAHGQALRWTLDMASLNVFPPAYTSREGGAPGERERYAREGDAVRVGVYPNDKDLLLVSNARLCTDLALRSEGDAGG